MKCIYALIDPRTRQIRYVGQSSDPERRYQQHINAAEDTPKGVWIQELRAMDQLPDFILIDECEDAEAFYLENWWILIGKRQGWPLTNGTNPGEWRAQEDFKQIFDAHLKAMEAEHKQALEKMETDAIRAARLAESKKWNGRTYFFTYAVMVCLCIFNMYATIARSSFFHVPIFTSFAVGAFWFVGVSLPYTHSVCKRLDSADYVIEFAFWAMFICDAMASVSFVYEMGAMSK